MRIETIAAHKVDPVTGAITAPIYLSTTFERDPDGEFSGGNPTCQALEEYLCHLEGGAAAFSSV